LLLSPSLVFSPLPFLAGDDVALVALDPRLLLGMMLRVERESAASLARKCFFRTPVQWKGMYLVQLYSGSVVVEFVGIPVPVVG